jgi:hypothetical protein
MGIFLLEHRFKVLLMGLSNTAMEALTWELNNLYYKLDYIHIRRGVAERQCLATAYLVEDTVVYKSLGAHVDYILPGLKAMESFWDTTHTIFNHVKRWCSRALNTSDSFLINITNHSGQTPGEEQEDAFAIVCNSLAAPKMETYNVSCEISVNRALTRESEKIFNKAYLAVLALVIEES